MDKLNIPEPVKVFLTSSKFINIVFFTVFCILLTLIIPKLFIPTNCGKRY